MQAPVSRSATVHQCLVQNGATPDTGLLRELVRFGVEQVLVLGGAPPYPALPRAMRFVGLPAAPDDLLAQAGLLLQERFLLCDANARLDFNLARLLAARAPAVAIRDGQDTGIRLMHRDSTAMAEPIPVTALPVSSPRPALFLDRDGTINVDHGYVGTRERFEWCRGALDAIRSATEAGWHVFVVTNQSGIARGLYDEAALAALHRWMVDEIRLAGGNVDDWRFCPFHEAAVIARYRKASAWRKPEPGMIQDLIDRWSLDPASCLMIGDQQSDLQAAAAAGIAARLVGDKTLLQLVAERLSPPK